MLFASISFLLAFASAHPILTRSCALSITVDELLAISNNTRSCDPTQDFAEECRNATQSVPFINQGLTRFNVQTREETAGLLSLILFETGDLKFDRNHFPSPGRPGQGTRNLMQFNFVYEYAAFLPETKDQAIKLQPVAPDATSDDPTSPTFISNDTKNAVLDLVLPDQFSFASAAWFLKTKCPQNVSSELAKGTCAGFQAYIGPDCINTSDDDGSREAGWRTALKVLTGADPGSCTQAEACA